MKDGVNLVANQVIMVNNDAEGLGGGYILMMHLLSFPTVSLLKILQEQVAEPILEILPLYR